VIDVKICGLCRPEDAVVAARAGATHAGVILAEHTRRSQSSASARAIYDAAPALKRVGVFVNPSLAGVRVALRELGLDILQLHGHESPETVRLAAQEAEVWKAVRVSGPADVQRALELYGTHVSALLLDASVPGEQGGSGVAFDWAAVAAIRRSWPSGPALVLAGGLNPENVAHAISLLHPDVVDVSSGVEESVGRKSAARVLAFVQAARGVHTVERIS
jgi:phosphoribosylanthranilate isomerase